MPSVVATLKIKADKIDEAKAFLRTLAANVRKNEPGTTAYVFHQRKDDPTVFVAYEKYTSDEAFKTHGANLRAHGAAFVALLDGRPEIIMLDEI
jgi:quinol monooxygenase YgiN